MPDCLQVPYPYRRQLLAMNAMGMGAVSPIIFSARGDAIEWIVRQRRVELIFRYDNFIVVGEARSNKCSQGLAILLRTCM